MNGGSAPDPPKKTWTLIEVILLGKTLAFTREYVILRKPVERASNLSCTFERTCAAPRSMPYWVFGTGTVLLETPQWEFPCVVDAHIPTSIAVVFFLSESAENPDSRKTNPQHAVCETMMAVNLKDYVGELCEVPARLHAQGMKLKAWPNWQLS